MTFRAMPYVAPMNPDYCFATFAAFTWGGILFGKSGKSGKGEQLYSYDRVPRWAFAATTCYELSRAATP
ncbi:hypothetical protein BH10ACT6_BH10ACT6_03200 [soil metagenome]